MSSCDLPSSESAQPDAARVSANGSRVHRFTAGGTFDAPHTWLGVAIEDYKAPAAHHQGVLRSVLVGNASEQMRFQVRYFEIVAGGFSSREHHAHEHVVFVVRGRGEVWLDGTWHEVAFGDTVYVAPREVHQFRNTNAEPFGFLCIVDAQRDRPVIVTRS